MKNITLTKITNIIMICFLLAGCSKNESNYYQGYIDADFRYMASNFSGVLEKLFVTYGTTITTGQSLFILDKMPEISDYQQAIAKVALQEDEIKQLAINVEVEKNKYNRRINLEKQKFSFKEEIEATGYGYERAKAQLDQAKQNLLVNQKSLLTAQWSLQKKSIESSTNGIVFDIFYRPGEFVPAGRPVLSLLAPQDVKIKFFVPEMEIGKIRLNQSVIITCDGCNNPIKANISFISPKAEFTPPVIYSEEEKTKLIFLVEAIADITTSKQLHPGQPARVKLQ